MATKKKPKTKKTLTPADVRVPVDASLKKQYDALKKEIDAAKADESRDWDRLWEAVGRVVEHDPPLYVVGGFRNDREFFTEVTGEEPRNAYRNVKVAKFASPREEQLYGVSKLEAAISYIEAKLGAPLKDPPLPVAFDRLRIGKARISLERARREEIEAATREIKKAPKAKPNSDERAATNALAKHEALKEVRVRVRGGVASFSGIPVASMGVFLKAVAKVDWGADASDSPRIAKRR